MGKRADLPVIGLASVLQDLERTARFRKERLELPLRQGDSESKRVLSYARALRAVEIMRGVNDRAEESALLKPGQRALVDLCLSLGADPWPPAVRAAVDALAEALGLDPVLLEPHHKIERLI